MVYCGKPSKGCQGCRTRKTKCDLTRPSCGQCIRTLRKCSGYRNELDLAFRNESATVIRKANARSTPSRDNAGRAGKSRALVVTAEAIEEKPLLPFGSLSTHHEEMGIPFFFSHHIIRPSAFSKGSLNCVVRLLDSEEIKSSVSPLTSAVKAVGLATYSNIVNSPYLRRAATTNYVKALRLTNISLSSPNEATKATVLLSVLLLSTFESITCTGGKNLLYWNNHVRGSIQLLSLRGNKQFETEDGLEMWHALTANIVSSCIQRECRVPETLIILRRQVSECIDIRSFHWRLVNTMISFVNLRADHKEKKISGVDLIDAANAISEAYAAHFLEPKIVEKLGFCNFITDAPKELAFQGLYSIYNDWRLVSMWNHMRITRVYVLKMVLDETHKLLHDEHHIENERRRILQENIPRISSTIQQLAKDICASVPQISGYAFSLNPTSSALPMETSTFHSPSNYVENLGIPTTFPFFESQPDILDPRYDLIKDSLGSEARTSDFHQQPNSSAAISLLWPLFEAAQCFSEEMRTWIINRMEYLGHTKGLGQALLLARLLRETPNGGFYGFVFDEEDVQRSENGSKDSGISQGESSFESDLSLNSRKYRVSVERELRERMLCTET